MSDCFWLGQEKLARTERYFPLSHGVPRVDDRRAPSGIIHVMKRGPDWRDAPTEYGRTKPFTIVSFAGARWLFSTIYSEPCHLRICLNNCR